MHAAMHTSVTLKNRSGLVFSLMPCHEQSNSPCPRPPLFCTLSCARVITSPGSWFELPPSTKATALDCTKTCSPPLTEGFEHLSTIRRRCEAACCEDKHGRVPLVQLSSAQLSSPPSLPGAHQARPPWGPRRGVRDTNQTAESTSQRAEGAGMPWRRVGQNTPRERTKTAKEKEYRREYLQQKTEKFHLLSSPDAPKHGQGERQTDGEKKSV